MRAGGAPRARRSPRRARTRRSTSSPTPTCCASGPARRPSPRSAGSSPGPRRYVELIENSSRPYIFTTAPTPADTAARARGAAGAALTGRRRARGACARTSIGSAPVTRRRSCRSCAARSNARSRPRRRSSRTAGRARHPAADRRARHVAPAGRDERRPHRRAGRPAARGTGRGVRRRTRLRGDDCSIMTVVVVAGTGTGIGKTWVTAELGTALRRRGIAVAARKPVQSFEPDDDHPTDADVLGGATGEDPHTVCPASPVAAARDGAADGRRCARAPTVHHRRPRRRGRTESDQHHRARGERRGCALPARGRRRHRRARRRAPTRARRARRRRRSSARSTSCG